jgi:hypothetical protein
LATDSSNSVEFDFEQKMTASLNQKDLYIKYIKKTEPAMIHIPDTATSSWKKPSLISHQLHPYLSYTLDSPLVSIYHQIEVTFQFEMEYEEIKLMIPLIIASVPKKENAVLYQEESMMKYTFEETARTGFLPYKLENRDLYTDKVKLQSYGDDIYSVLREPDTKMKTLVDESRESLQDGTTDCDDDDILMPYFSTAPNTTLEAKPGFSEPEFHHYGEQPRTLKKYTSAFDLGSGSHSNNMHNIENTPEERPRTTTPTMKRYHPTHHRKVLQPIDVELANNPDKRAKSPHPPPTIPPPPLPVESRSNSHSPSSDILPTVDKHRAVRQELASNYASTKKRDYTKDGLRSPYSEMSSDYEPSLSPSNSRSSTKSYPALQSRPASPLFCTAPGLPATIALQPQESNLFQVEETFPTSDASLSPALNTVASSILLSPRTTNSMRRRIALSTISSLTNDSISNGSSFISRNRASSTVDPDIHSIVAAACSLSSGSSAPPNRYINARLPPLPMLESTDCIENKRLTRLYLEDSDEEDDDETKSIQSYLSVDIGPPRLPRLSFGNDLSISLGIN